MHMIKFWLSVYDESFKILKRFPIKKKKIYDHKINHSLIMLYLDFLNHIKKKEQIVYAITYIHYWKQLNVPKLMGPASLVRLAELEENH